MAVSTESHETRALRSLVDAHRSEFDRLLSKDGATRSMLFGSVARGTAGQTSDIDILVEMDPADGNLLLRASGLMEEVRQVLGTDAVDIFPVQFLRSAVTASALADVVPL